MSIREENAKKAISKILSSSKTLKFPALITKLRKSLGMTRIFVSSDSGIRHSRMVSLESSKKWKRHPHENEVKKLATYYGIPIAFLLKSTNLKLSKRKLHVA